MQHNSAQHSGPAQDLSLQHLEFCRSSHTAQIFASQLNKKQRQELLHNYLFIFSFTMRRTLWKKSTTVCINRPTVNLSLILSLCLSLIHTVNYSATTATSLQHKHTHTHISAATAADVAMDIFFILSNHLAMTNADAVSVQKYTL